MLQTKHASMQFVTLNIVFFYSQFYVDHVSISLRYISVFLNVTYYYLSFTVFKSINVTFLYIWNYYAICYCEAWLHYIAFVLLIQ